MLQINNHLSVGIIGVLPLLAALSHGAPVEFNRDVRPILSDKCFSCHGPDSKNRLTKLRFDTEAGAKQDLGGRFAIVPGDLTKSGLIQRITSGDAANRMPPATTGRTLTQGEMETLRRWVQDGAKWQEHWAWMSPTRADAPKVSRAGWRRNAIDDFVMERLDRDGLTPSPEATRERLIRRVSLDLTGLPPKPAEVDAFLADQSADAYEKVVDRLLGSSHYGERMAERWLDAARYADSHGYQTDGERQMWRWRDWVIDAFNRNMPFDQFTIEQIAGDMLPNATLDQKIASGFNRNHRANGEGGIVPEEYQVEYVADRAETTASVWLGLTVGCARCHNHKYDPVTQKEFYQLFAYFNNVPEKGRVRKVGNTEPMIPAPTPEQQPALRDLDRKLQRAEEKFQALQAQLTAAQRQWEGSFDVSKPLDGSITRSLLERFELASPEVKGKWQDGKLELTAGRTDRAAKFDGKLYFDAGKAAPLGNDEKFTIGAWVKATAPNGGIVSRTPDVSETTGFGEYMTGYGLYLKAGKLVVNVVSRWQDNALSVEAEQPVPLNTWNHILVSYDGSKVADGVQIYFNGLLQKQKIVLDDLTSNIKAKEPLRIGAGGGPANRFQGWIQEVRVYDAPLTAKEAAIAATPESIRDIIAIPPARRTEAQAGKLQLYYLRSGAPAEIAKAWQELTAAREEHARYVDTLPTVMVMQEVPRLREAHILIRGAYDKPGELVTPGVPAILPPLPKGVPNNRLGLARWLNPSNPLTARVFVNRLWEMCFGVGLVKTVEDFGSQGEWPSHPALLDWMATEFVRTGWNIKAVQKLIVMSATYRQSSKVTGELQQRDPENRLLARGPRVRLPAETIRDQALYVSGLLTTKIGGPSVKPYQPASLWKELLSAEYPQDHGESLYRRSLYTFWRRTAPPPSMMNFDAGGRETCIVRRGRTNTPLQALDLMNNVSYLEASRVLGERMIKEGGRKPEERIAYAFLLATSRRPTEREREVLVNNFHFQLDKYLTDRQAALQYLKSGEYRRDESLDPSELAAYSVIASLILNLDEVVTKL